MLLVEIPDRVGDYQGVVLLVAAACHHGYRDSAASTLGED